jgi:hypothetical protein
MKGFFIVVKQTATKTGEALVYTSCTDASGFDQTGQPLFIEQGI